MKRSFIISLLSAFALASEAQIFQPQVKIEFEKVVYVRQHYKEMFSEWYEEFKNMIPEKVTNQYEFIGDTTQSLFRESKEAVLPPNTWYEEVANKNVVYNNYASFKTITPKTSGRRNFFSRRQFAEDPLEVYKRHSHHSRLRLQEGYWFCR